jgi:hypothetical protein
MAASSSSNEVGSEAVDLAGRNPGAAAWNKQQKNQKVKRGSGPISPHPKNHAADDASDETSDDKVFLEQAKALLPIYPVLWRHFKFPEPIGNPTNSPFRTDTDPSFATEDKMACEYDFTISHRSLVDPETKVSKIRFVSDSGKSLVLEGWRRNMTFVQPHPMDQNRPSPKTGERIPNSPQEGPSRTPQIISLRLVGRNTVLKTRPDHAEKSGDPARGCRYLAWLFQKAYLQPKLVCIKSFTDELKLCWPPLSQL